ncbi:hypothetical protein HYH03_001372 [Edaphochlamys debaryana]|uniref:Protein kinase domain-containing protein n=1 Tax=Edaphochlamys debaryana TaxID=47281 RepID=A0A836C668_9CHLO|nr:hypothetical protein HYH03_001372 [Edaphochlamys debaryana]|eukprot:KAG2500604.1 hypothetical protein HYH03_001372 [Edaphochlamys debaryana]
MLERVQWNAHYAAAVSNAQRLPRDDWPEFMCHRIICRACKRGFDRDYKAHIAAHEESCIGLEQRMPLLRLSSSGAMTGAASKDAEQSPLPTPTDHAEVHGHHHRHASSSGALPEPAGQLGAGLEVLEGAGPSGAQQQGSQQWPRLDLPGAELDLEMLAKGLSTAAAADELALEPAASKLQQSGARKRRQVDCDFLGEQFELLPLDAADGAWECELSSALCPAATRYSLVPLSGLPLVASTRDLNLCWLRPGGQEPWRQLFRTEWDLATLLGLPQAGPDPQHWAQRVVVQAYWEVQLIHNVRSNFWSPGSFRGAFLLIPKGVFTARPAVLAAPPPPLPGGPLPPPAPLPRPGAVYGSRLRARVSFMLPSLPEQHSQLVPAGTLCDLVPYDTPHLITASIHVASLAPHGPGGSRECTYTAHVLDPQPGPGLGLLVAFYSITDGTTEQGLFQGTYLVVPEWAAGQVDAMQLGTGGTQGGPGRGGRSSENGEHDPSNDGAGGGPGTAGGDGGGGGGGPGWAPSGGVWGYGGGNYMQRSAGGGAPHGQAHGPGGGGTAAAADPPPSGPAVLLHVGVAVLAVAASAACFCLWPALFAALGLLAACVAGCSPGDTQHEAGMGSHGPVDADVASVAPADAAGPGEADRPAERQAAGRRAMRLGAQHQSLPAHASPGPSPFALAPTALSAVDIRRNAADASRGRGSRAGPQAHTSVVEAEAQPAASTEGMEDTTAATHAPEAWWRRLCAAVPPYAMVTLVLFVLLGSLAFLGARYYTGMVTHDRRNWAADVASEAARSVETVLDRLISPLHALVSHVRLDPRWDRVNASFPAVAQSIYDVTPFYELELCPLGLVGAISVPWLNLTGEARWRMYQDLDFGLDMMDPERPSFPLELESITRDGSAVLMGPWYAPAGELADGAYAVRYSIWQPPGEWEQTMPTPNSIAACPAAVCTRPDGLRWWGWANAVFAFRHVLQRLAPLADRGLLYSLEPDPRSSNQSMLANSERLPDPIACERVKIDVYGTYTWTLCVQPAAGFEPAWAPWLHAGVLALALLIAGLLGLLLRSREQALDANQRLAVANAKADRALQTLNVLFAEMGKIEDLVTAVQRGGGPEVVKLRGQVRRVMRTFEEAQSPSGGAGNLELRELIGEGSFGRVYKAYWREKGIEVAVKRLRGPFGMSGDTEHDKEAIKEVAFRLSHPNIVRLIDADVQPLPQSLAQSGSPGCEVLLILELCDLGSLRDALDLGAFRLPASPPAPDPGPSLQDHAEDGKHGQAQAQGEAQAQAQGGLNYRAVLDAAIDVACAMEHLHGRRPCVLHGDLKPANVLLASACTGTGGRGVVFKVADFSLSVTLEQLQQLSEQGPAAGGSAEAPEMFVGAGEHRAEQTHVSGLRQGTPTHMAPEVLLYGKVSKAADVYSYGIMLWELYTGQRLFAGLPQERLVAQVADASERLRPQFPPDAPEDYKRLACECWDHELSARPPFAEILRRLGEMRAALPGPAPPLRPFSSRRPAAEGTAAAEALREAAGPIPRTAALAGTEVPAPATVSRLHVPFLRGSQPGEALSGADLLDRHDAAAPPVPVPVPSGPSGPH